MGALQLVTALHPTAAPEPRRTRRGEPRSPPSDRHPPARGEAPEAPSARPDLLGLALPPVARLAVEPDRRTARDRPPLASRRVPTLLALEVTEALRPAQARRGDPCPHPSHVRDNPTWGQRRIRSELHLLGYEVAELTVAKYMVRGRKPPSQGWRVFLKNHSREIAAIDFFTVVTLNFRILICFVVLRHHQRTVVHFNVTSHPTARWTAQQIVEAFPYDTAPRYLLRDRDGIYSPYFADRVRGMGIEEVLIAPRSPWQSPYVERMIGSIRRECLDHVLVINEGHLLRVLREYFAYYHDSRPHQSLDGNAPRPREIEPPSQGRIIAEPQVGGLHHRYRRAA